MTLNKTTLATAALGLVLVFLRLSLFDIPDQIRFDPASDFNVYARALGDLTSTRFFAAITSGRFEPGFLLLLFAMARLGLPIEALPALITFALTVSFFAFCRQAGAGLALATLGCAVFVFSPMIDAFTLVAMRQGLSLALILLAVTAHASCRRAVFALFATAAALTHLSAILFIGLFLLAKTRLSQRVIILLTPLIFLAYALDIFTTLLPAVGAMLSQILGYAGTTAYQTGFRLNFLAAGIIAVLPLYVASLTRLKHPRIQVLCNWTAACVLLYMLASAMPYYDRLATTSWALGLACWSAVLSRFVIRKPRPLQCSTA